MSEPIDLEYAYKLASTLKWRTWPEEKPGAWVCIALKINEDLFPSGAIAGIGDVYCITGKSYSIPFKPGDRWMYLRDLEVVR